MKIIRELATIYPESPTSIIAQHFEHENLFFEPLAAYEREKEQHKA
jgi:hypothetical protein